MKAQATAIMHRIHVGVDEELVCEHELRRLFCGPTEQGHLGLQKVRLSSGGFGERASREARANEPRLQCSKV